MSPTTLRRFSMVFLCLAFGAPLVSGGTDCQENEVYVMCGQCEGTCEKPRPTTCFTGCRDARCECVRSNGYVRAHDGKCIRLEDCVEYPKRWANEEYYGGYINATKTQSTLQPVMSEAPSVPIQAQEPPVTAAPSGPVEIPAPDKAQPVPAEPATLAPAAFEPAVATEGSAQPAPVPESSVPAPAQPAPALEPSVPAPALAQRAPASEPSVPALAPSQPETGTPKRPTYAAVPVAPTVRPIYPNNPDPVTLQGILIPSPISSAHAIPSYQIYKN